MVSNWEEVTLDSLVDFTPKRTIKKGVLAPFVSMADIAENSKYIPEFFEKEYAGGGSRFKNGDTLFARITPCLQNGKCSKVTGLLDNSIAHGSTEFIVMAAKKPEFDSDFIYYLVRTPHFRAFAESRMIGSTGRQRVSWQDLAEYELIAPRQHERKLIGKVLSKFDEKIELNRQTNETLEAMAQALFKSWFVDFDPVIDNALLAGKAIPKPLKERAELRQAQLDSGKAKTNSEINDLFPSEFEFTEELGWIPKGWEGSTVKELVEVTDYVANGSFASLKKNVTLRDSPDYALYIRTTDYKNDFSLVKAKYVDKHSYDFLQKSALEGYEVIISNVGDTGTVFRPPIWLNQPMTLGSNAIALKSKNMSNFLQYYFSSGFGQYQISSIVGGSAQPKFNKTDFRALRVYYGSDQLVDRFEKACRPIRKKIDSNLSQILLLSKLRDTLLPKLMSGELRIPDAEKLVENI